eukprot:gene9877-18466_t
MAFFITSLCIFFEGERKSISRESIAYIPGVLKGEVRASMKGKVYVDESYLIKSTQCECPRGEFKCSHAAALFIHTINSISVTDVECSWKKQKTDNFSTHVVSELYQPRGPEYVPLTREPDDEDKFALYADLCNYGRSTGLWWLLSPEPQKQEKAQKQLLFCCVDTIMIGNHQKNRDPSWEKNIEKVKNFYFGNILPKIMNDELF